MRALFVCLHCYACGRFSAASACVRGEALFPAARHSERILNANAYSLPIPPLAFLFVSARCGVAAAGGHGCARSMSCFSSGLLVADRVSRASFPFLLLLLWYRLRPHPLATLFFSYFPSLCFAYTLRFASCFLDSGFHTSFCAFFVTTPCPC